MPSPPAPASTAERAQIAADLAPVMLWMATADESFDWVNAAWVCYTGRPVEALTGGGWRVLLHPEDSERCFGIYAASFEARQAFTLDYRLRRHDGQYRWVLDSGVPRYTAKGEFAGFIGSVVDIHVRKEFEERLAERTQALRLAERRQASFLGMLSHELRNPLAPIANAASVLRTLEDRNPILVRLREIIERQVGRLGRLVEDLVEATRAAQGQISLVSEQVPVDTLVQGAVASTADTVSTLGHTLDVSLPDEPLVIKGDLTRLTQALANIIGNAAKFTPEPGVISLEVSHQGDKVRIAVTDPGQGISAEFLPHVFELFAQQNQTLHRKPGGLGVGLTLARRIAQLHNGDIEPFSAGPGKGSRFTLTLPLIPAGGATDDALSLPPMAENYRILIIEDEDDAREALRLQLEIWGNEVQVAASAEEGLRAAATFKPHIVLCDIGLPGLNGLELLKPLREALAEQRTMFAAVTGHGRHQDEARALAAGYDSFLVKPLQPGSLVRLLRAYSNLLH